MQKDPWYKAGLKFQCTQCHDCCRLEPGYVFLSWSDLKTISAHLGRSCEEFVQQYCRWEDLGEGPVLCLLEKTNYDCFFWDQGCTVYAGRPSQCRTYPFWKNVMENQASWNWESRFCPGMNQGSLRPSEEIEAALSLREQNPPIKLQEWKEKFHGC